MGKVVTREWRKAKVLNWNLHSFQLFRDNSSFGLNILGPLCLWQCFRTAPLIESATFLREAVQNKTVFCLGISHPTHPHLGKLSLSENKLEQYCS